MFENISDASGSCRCVAPLTVLKYQLLLQTPLAIQGPAASRLLCLWLFTSLHHGDAAVCCSRDVRQILHSHLIETLFWVGRLFLVRFHPSSLSGSIRLCRAGLRTKGTSAFGKLLSSSQ